MAGRPACAVTGVEWLRDSTTKASPQDAAPLLPPPRSLLFVAVIAANLLQCALGLMLFQAIYPEGDLAAPPGPIARLRACMLAVMACGVAWLVFYGCMSPLPFRWATSAAIQQAWPPSLLAGLHQGVRAA